MKQIMKPIFELLTGECILFDNVIYNYIWLGIVGALAFAIAWRCVGILYDYDIIDDKVTGSIIHWCLRLISFLVIFDLFSWMLWLINIIDKYKKIILVVLVFLILFVIEATIIKVIPKKIYKKKFILKKSIAKKSEDTKEIIDIVAGIFSSVNPNFAVIPLFTYAVNRVLGLASPDYIKERLSMFSDRLEKRKITIEEFKVEVKKLSEHDEYIVLNHLRDMLLTCVPEMLDIYIEVIIDFIMKKNYKNGEEICEIISQLNVNDLNLMKKIKNYIDNEKQESKLFKQDETLKSKENESGLKKIVFQDRNMIVDDKYTIFWKEFERYYDLKSGEMGLILLFKTKNENGMESDEWARIGRAFLKLQNLGVLEIECANTVGTINVLNIDRFHITLFGREILEYIGKCSDVIELSGQNNLG